MTAQVRCPKCGGETWNNVMTKRNPRAPDYRCKDRGCDGAIWPDRDGRSARASSVTTADAPSVLQPRAELERAPVGQGAAPAEREKLTSCYLSTLDFVLASVLPRYAKAGVPMDAATVSAVTAQLFIARCKSA